MKKLGLIVKEVSENRIKDLLKKSNSVFIIKYSGLSSPDMSTLRSGLKSANAGIFVAKNSVARRALKSAGFEGLCDKIDGPSAFVFASDEPVGTAKALSDFNKAHDKMKLEAGLMQDKILTKADIEALAKLPPKEVLRAQVVVTLNAPISKLVIVLNQTLKKFVICLDQIKQKKTS